jgi:hypothetical protein
MILEPESGCWQRLQAGHGPQDNPVAAASGSGGGAERRAMRRAVGRAPVFPHFSIIYGENRNSARPKKTVEFPHVFQIETNDVRHAFDPLPRTGFCSRPSGLLRGG